MNAELDSKKVVLLAVILVTACLPQFSSDVYAPSIPEIANSLKSDIALVQKSLVVFMYGVASTLLAFGVISEAFGRKKPLIAGFMIMLIGSLVCVFASTAKLLIIGRFIQGLGAGAATGIWRAIFRDTFSGEELSKYGSYLSLAVTFVIPAAPFFGSLLAKHFGWHSTFILLTLAIVVSIALLAFFYNETTPNPDRAKLAPKFIVGQFKRIFTSRIFLCMTICTLLGYGAYFSWFVVGPVLLVHRVGMSPVHFGILNFLGGALMYTLAGLINGRFVKFLGTKTMLRLGWLVALFSAFAMLIINHFAGVTLWGLYLPTMGFTIGILMTLPNAFSMAMEPFGDIAGYAGAAYSFMQILGGGIIGYIVTYLPTTNQAPLALTFIVCIGTAWIFYEIVLTKH